MNRKVIYYIALFFLLIINLIFLFNIESYFGILKDCFNINVILSPKIYTLILITIALISILISVAIKLVIQNKNDEINGIKFKIEDGTYGTANWMSNEEMQNVLGVIDNEEYRIVFKS